VLAIDMLAQDLETLVTFINACYPRLMEGFESFLNKFGVRPSAQDKFLAFKEDKVAPSSESSLSAIKTITHSASGSSGRLGTGTAVYPPHDNASGDGLRK